MAGRALQHRGRDASGHVDPYHDRRKRYDAILRMLGTEGLFAAIPPYIQEAFYRNKYPDPVLAFDESFARDRQNAKLRRTLEKRFREAQMHVNGAPVSVRDYWAVVIALTHCARGALTQRDMPETGVRFAREALGRLEQWFPSGMDAMWQSLHRAVIMPLVATTQLDARLAWVSVRDLAQENGKYILRMTVHQTDPQVRQVTLDGAARPMVRVGTTNEWNEVKWAEWDGKPVYAQSHALRQLRQRVNLPRMAEYLESWIYDSLREPVVVEQTGGGLLIEYRLGEHRIGYLVATPMQDMLAVRTFLFLTMEQTPEGRMLRKRLRLTRRDVDWLGLAELTTFTRTDLREDDALRAIMEECGCGHLFELEDEDYAPQPKAVAAQMRKYLRMAA